MRYLFYKQAWMPLISFVGLTMALIMTPAYGADVRWYQVEIIIAERLTNAIDEEQHPKQRAPAVLSNHYLKDYPNIGSQAYTRQPKEWRRLNSIAKRLTNSGQYRILFHEAWPMDIIKQKAPTWIQIQGHKISTGQHELEGAVGVSLGRYLHLHTNLHLNKFIESKDTNQAQLNQLFNYPRVQAGVSQRYTMQQQRKMRSVELHYLDHPKLLLLVRFDPYDLSTGPLPKPLTQSHESALTTETPKKPEALPETSSNVTSPISKAITVPLVD